MDNIAKQLYGEKITCVEYANQNILKERLIIQFANLVDIYK